MRILLLSVRSDFGGGPRHVDQLINGLPVGECEIFLAYPREGVPYADLWIDNKRVKDSLFLPYRKFSIKALWELRKFVNRNDIDIVHSHGNGAGLYSRALKLLCMDVKVVHTFHGISDEYNSKIKFYVLKIIGRLLAPLADKYIAVSYGEKALGVKWGFCKDKQCEVIYNGIKDEGLGDYNYMLRSIVTISRYDYQKNMSLCLDIVRLTKDDGFKYIWVGDGEDFSYMKEVVEKEKLPIEMVGFQSQPMNFLKKSSIYLSTSRFEGLPYALIEAASVGIPLVVTDVKGNNEVAINDVNGLTFNTAAEGVSAIRKVLGNEALYKQMSKNSRLQFESKFEVGVMIDNLTQVYKNLYMKSKCIVLGLFLLFFSACC